MKVCGVPQCRRRYDGKDDITFHRFPKNEEVKKEWLKAIGRPNWSPGKFTTICSSHFENTCFMEGGVKRILYRNAVPSRNIISNQNQARRPYKNRTQETIQNCIQIKINSPETIQNCLQIKINSPETIQNCLQIKIDSPEEQNCTGRIQVVSYSSKPQICNSEDQNCTGRINVDSSSSNPQICNIYPSNRRIKLDHNYCKQKVTAQSQYERSQLRKQIRTQQQKIRRREKKIERLKGMKIKNPKIRRRERRIDCFKDIKSSECLKEVESSECLKETESSLIWSLANDNALIENTFETHLMRSFCF